MKKVLRIILAIILISLISKAEYTDSKASSNIDSINKIQYQVQQSEIQLQKERI